jgi:hypothetical protein
MNKRPPARVRGPLAFVDRLYLAGYSESPVYRSLQLPQLRG